MTKASCEHDILEAVGINGSWALSTRKPSANSYFNRLYVCKKCGERIMITAAVSYSYKETEEVSNDKTI